MRMIAEYLYHDGQIDAADAVCKVRTAVDVRAMRRLSDLLTFVRS